jgi:hypothetical protein
MPLYFQTAPGRGQRGGVGVVGHGVYGQKHKALAVVAVRRWETRPDGHGAVLKPAGIDVR